MEIQWIAQMNEAIEYIESQLTSEIDYEQLGRLACCSSYQFQRMFGYIAGVPLAEYIRRRKMSRAAVDLQSGEKVLDVALKYGYSSPTAFSRAFQSVHGLSPSQMKHDSVIVKSYLPLTFKLTVKGAVEMNYRIEKKEAFRVIGLSCPMSQELEENFKNIPLLWDKVEENGFLEQLACLSDGSEPKGLLGVCSCIGQESDWRYYIAVASMKQIEGMEEYEVPAATWAIFSGNSGNEPVSKAIQDMEQRIISEWLPSSGYSYGNGPDLEVYLNDDSKNMEFEVWIPVIKN